MGGIWSDVMSFSIKIRTVIVAAIAAFVGAALLAGCGTTKATHPATFNDSDVTFVSGMIPHHQQAVVMADWAVKRASDPRVQALAKRITAAQGPEIATMTSWLKAWGQPVPDAYDPDSTHGGHAMEGMDMGSDGMMSAADMNALKRASGTAFDQTFLSQMIEHHEGAIEMAKVETRSGTNTSAVKLAGRIAKAQTAEIAEMKDLLAK